MVKVKTMVGKSVKEWKKDEINKFGTKRGG
jgi:hypothetical protein